MAAGIWKKIKNGLHKAWNGVKKAAGWLNNKVIKPVVKPIANVAAPVIDSILPGAGTAIKAGVNIGSGIIDGDRGSQRQAIDWAKANIPIRFKSTDM